jgi:hypothetical protein
MSEVVEKGKGVVDVVVDEGIQDARASNGVNEDGGEKVAYRDGTEQKVAKPTELVAKAATLGSKWNWLNWTCAAQL